MTFDTSTQPTWVMDVEVTELSLASTRDERVRWVVKVLVEVRPAGALPAPRPKRRAYERASAYGSLSNWLEEGEFAGAGPARVCGDLATQIVSDLTAKRQAGEAPR